jgi:hypothetical protein
MLSCRQRTHNLTGLLWLIWSENSTLSDPAAVWGESATFDTWSLERVPVAGTTCGQEAQRWHAILSRRAEAECNQAPFALCVVGYCDTPTHQFSGLHNRCDCLDGHPYPRDVNDCYRPIRERHIELTLLQRSAEIDVQSSRLR